MIKKKDPSQEDKKTWEEYIKNPSDIYDKDQGASNSVQRRERYKFDLHGFTLDEANNKVKEIIEYCAALYKSQRQAPGQRVAPRSGAPAFRGPRRKACKSNL